MIPTLIARDLTHKYASAGAPRSEVHAIDALNFEVRPGEILGLVGPSGGGKTTLLNIVAGFIMPTSGQVCLDDVPIEGPGPNRVMIFQDDAVFPWYSVEDNVRYALKAWERYQALAAGKRQNRPIVGALGSLVSSMRPKTNSDEDRVSELLGLTGIDHKRYAYPKELSWGERKRVELARAFVVHHEIILADEPFANLDVITRRRLQDVLLNLWRVNPSTIVMATHDLDEALRLSDRILVLTGLPGRIAAILDVPIPRDDRGAGADVRSDPPMIALRKRIEESMGEPCPH